jgi:hypothetical protein
MNILMKHIIIHINLQIFKKFEHSHPQPMCFEYVFMGLPIF